jgi:iron complex outermembrane receptor protein
MKYPSLVTRSRSGLIVVFGLLLAAAHGQTPGPKPSGGEALIMNPFDVTESGNKGYMATNTISGTAMNTPLRDVPMAINVITAEFLADSLVGLDIARAFDFNSSITQTQRQPVSNNGGSFAIRGFRNRNTLVDGVSAGEFVAPIMIDRIEVVKGPNTLYGQSDPGGLINVISKRPLGRQRYSLTQKVGNRGYLVTELDANPAPLGKLGVRLLGSSTETDGYRKADGRTIKTYGVASDYKLTRDTTVLFHLSTSRSSGIPAQRGAFAFELIPTDLNGDGVISTTVGANGVTESTARFNNTFLPRDYTAQTVYNHFDQTNNYLQTGVRHVFNSHVTIQYVFFRTDLDMAMNWREFNTFNPIINDRFNPRSPGTSIAIANSADLNTAAQSNHDRNEAHTFNALVSFPTAGLNHRMIVGGRYEWSQNIDRTFNLRALNAVERPILESMIASGRNIRLFLTKADVLAGAKYWLDDVPRYDELRARGTRNGTVDYGDTYVGNAYVTDSVSLLDNRLKILGGGRYVRIRSQSTDVTGKKIGFANDQSKKGYQIGAVFDVMKDVALFANLATAFNPNGADPNNTGLFYPAEESKAFEVGVKLLDLWRGKINGTLSYYDIKKRNVVNSDFNPVTFLTVTEITDQQATGFDAELFLNWTNHWQTVVNYSHNKGRVVKSVTLSLGLALEGATPDRTTVFTNYAFREGALKGLRLGGGVIVARGPIQQFGTSSSRLVLENGYTTYNAFARYEAKLMKRSVTFGLNVDNLTDTDYFRSRGGRSDPRQYVGSVRIDF